MGINMVKNRYYLKFLPMLVLLQFIDQQDLGKIIAISFDIKVNTRFTTYQQ